MKDLVAKPLIKEIYASLKERILKLPMKPILAVVCIGDDPASDFYLRNIVKNGEKIGLSVQLNKLHYNVTEERLFFILNEYNDDPSVTGIMLQKPFPKHINESKVAAVISPLKDVDGFTPWNLGKLMLDEDSLFPNTPAAVMELLSYYNIDLTGKHTVLCGRSHIVGKPLLNLLIRKQNPGNATVTLCHSRTKYLTDHTQKADILITALGIPRFIKADMIKEGAIVIDVGTNEITENGKTFYVGDVDYEDCYDKVDAITPVPGGIGSITTAMLLKNTIKALDLQSSLSEE